MTHLNSAHLPLPPARLLDIGAADGNGAMALAAEGYQVVGVEYDGELIRRFSGRAFGVPGVRADARHLPFRDASVDVAVLIEVLEHIHETHTVLNDVARALRHGGTLCVAVPTSYTERLYRRLHPRYATNAGHVRVFQRSELRDALSGAGFEVRASTTANLLPALSWVIHALLRSEADQTGTIYEHLWVDKVLNRLHHEFLKLNVGKRLWMSAERRIGKSVYVYGTRS